MTENVKYGLVVSFPDQSETFVLGFEAGSIWQKMTSGAAAEIIMTSHTENREVIARMATSEGWDIEVKPCDIPGWDVTKMEKRRAAPERPNPHGLRLV